MSRWSRGGGWSRQHGDGPWENWRGATGGYPNPLLHPPSTPSALCYRSKIDLSDQRYILLVSLLSAGGLGKRET